LIYYTLRFPTGDLETYVDYEPFGKLDEVVVRYSDPTIERRYFSRQHALFKVTDESPRVSDSMEENFHGLQRLVERRGISTNAIPWIDHDELNALQPHEAQAMRDENQITLILDKEFPRSFPDYRPPDKPQKKGDQ
jgi:hypothetical protein